MSEHEDELKKALAENGTFDAEKGGRIAAVAVARFDSRLRWTERCGWIFLLLCMAVFEFALISFALAFTTKEMIAYAVAMLLSCGIGVCVAMNSQITSMLLRVLKEIKQLQLAHLLGHPLDRSAVAPDGPELFAGRAQALTRRETIGWVVVLVTVAITVVIGTYRGLPWVWPFDMSRFEGVPVTLDGPPGSPIYVRLYLRMGSGSCKVLQVTPKHEQSEVFWMGEGFATIKLSGGNALRLDPQGNKGEYWVRFE